MHPGRTGRSPAAVSEDVSRLPDLHDGSGVTVGILSDSFDTATTFDRDGNRDTAATDIAAGLLPADLAILDDHAGGSDEGRAMAQIVHRTAPGASILFDTAAGGQAVFAQHILDLAAAGAKVIVDDVGYAAEPDYQDGVVAQAIERVTAQGVAYVSAAGNNGAAGYEGAFRAGGHFRWNGIRYTAQSFSTGGGPLADTLLPISGQAGQVATIQLAWSQPAASASAGRGATGDLDLFLTDARGNVVDRIAAAHDNVGRDPVEVLDLHLPETGTFDLRVGLRDGTEAPGDLRIVAISDGRPLSIGAVSSATGNATLIGHKGAPGDIAVGAARSAEASSGGAAFPVSEPFSSAGPDMRLFDDGGDPLPSPAVGGVSVSGSDGVPTSFFGRGGRVDADGDPLFFGTSAAAPQVAAVAALLLQQDPLLTPAEVRRTLQDTALPTVDSSGAWDPQVGGSGLVQAGAALDEVARMAAFAATEAVPERAGLAGAGRGRQHGAAAVAAGALAAALRAGPVHGGAAAIHAGATFREMAAAGLSVTHPPYGHPDAFDHPSLVFRHHPPFAL